MSVGQANTNISCPLEHNVQLIVGLGNPGPEYVSTRHNVGAWLVEMLANNHHLSFNIQAKFKGQLCQLKQHDQICWLLIPTTYMNHSGQAVRALANFYKIAPQHILVVHDELDFPAGVIKLKQGGGHGGHNGLRDIIAQLGSADFQRLRIGIGHPGTRTAVSSYVLNKPTSVEQELILTAINKGLSVVTDLLLGQTQKAMRELHK